MDRRLLAAVFGPGSRLALEADLSDADLLARFAAQAEGHDAAFAEVVRRHGPMVWAVCRRLLPEPADAEDAFQATFLALVQSPRSVRRSGSLPGWLYGVACRAAARLKRSAVRQRQREQRAAVPDRSSPVPESAWDAAYSVLQDEVARLPEALRTAFLVCDVGGVAQPEAARQLGWKLGTLSGRLSKARSRLAAALTTRGIGPAAAAAALAVTAGDSSAVPWKLAELVTAFGTPAAGTVPAALITLATEATVMGLSRLKLLAITAVAAGGVSVSFGPVLLPRADAQRPARAAAPAAQAKPAAPAAPRPAVVDTVVLNSTTFAVTSGWEYEFADVPAELPALKKLLADKGKDGWEFTGTVKGWDARAVASPTPAVLDVPAEVAVFKRPAGGRVSGNITQGLPVPKDGPGVGNLFRNAPPPVLDELHDLSAWAPGDASPEVAALRAEVDRLKAELARARGPAAGVARSAPPATQSLLFTRVDPEDGMKEARRTLDALGAKPGQKQVALNVRSAAGGGWHLDLVGATPEQTAAVTDRLIRLADEKAAIARVELAKADAKQAAGRAAGKDAPPVTIRTRGPANAELVALVEAMLGDEAIPAGGPVRVRPYGASIVLFRATPDLVAKVKKFVAEVEEADVPVAPDIPEARVPLLPGIPSPAVPTSPSLPPIFPLPRDPQPAPPAPGGSS